MNGPATAFFKEKEGIDLSNQPCTWPLLEEMVKNGIFAEIDLYFAQRILKSNATQELGSLLCALMRSARLGHLCLNIDDLDIELNKIAPLIQSGATHFTLCKANEPICR